MTGDDPQEVEDDARIDGMGATPVIVTRWADGTTPTGPAPTGLEPGEIVAVPTDLQSLADEIERHAAMVPPEDMRGAWEDGRQSAYRNVLAWIANGIPGDTACADARPIQDGDPR